MSSNLLVYLQTTSLRRVEGWSHGQTNETQPGDLAIALRSTTPKPVIPINDKQGAAHVQIRNKQIGFRRLR